MPSLDALPSRDSVSEVHTGSSPSDDGTEVNEMTLEKEDSLPTTESMMETSCRQQQNVDDCGFLLALAMRRVMKKPEGEYPCIAGLLYRSRVPYAVWQLRFHQFAGSVLRFSKPSPGGKRARWWKVLTGRELLHVELDNGNTVIGEAHPPNCSHGQSCISIYFKKRTEAAPRRLRLCSAKQRDTLAWFFALRYVTQQMDCPS
ncbi:hypothetical protein TraAM80_00270 [Trypanosoma rangeli]|uniref:PH domain-containing protein n=1 Tax=Trypanosoma rangeli TaxID=5698 RepID=A0A422P4G1_TRYRA|nr:uncharacterized protein TraAM80_00270 [Trypanosoma rangeli]RNF12554.1 hypothetical protein TraAM80_00270 [Trypanosoma rangeli]|eukprot:RNF12554.1 hypothetical protein TraAM80_00270 [Trypanosoma rangeli]